MKDYLKDLKELRRKAGYEPNIWYEEQEESYLETLISEVRKDTLEEVEKDFMPRLTTLLTSSPKYPNAVWWIPEDEIKQVLSTLKTGGKE